MSTVQNNSNPVNLQSLINLNFFSINLYIPFYQSNMVQGNTSINLTKGYYYFEFFNLDKASGGYFKIMVEMPSLRQYSKNPSWQIDRVYISTSSSNTVGITGNFTMKAGGINMTYGTRLNINFVTDTGLLWWFFYMFYKEARISCSKTIRSVDGYTL